MKIKQIAKRIEQYLKTDCAEEWHINVKENEIIAYFENTKKFTITYDEDFEDWYIDGKYIHIGMIGEISLIIKLYEERGY